MFYKKHKRIKIFTQILIVFVFFVSFFTVYKKTNSESTSWWYVNVFDNVMGIKGIVLENNTNNNTGYPTKNNCEEWRTSYINQLPAINGSMGQKYTKETLPSCFLSTYEKLEENKPIVSSIGSDPINITPRANTGEEIDPNTYKLLAPIGDFKEITTNNIGDYFNKFFLLAIGLAGALAVIMLIIGGVQWMGTDSVFGKTEAKKQITSAILGLLIAIGSYALLNTINPDLLGKRGLSVNQVSIEIVNLPDVGDGSVDPDFGTKSGTFSISTPVSPGVLGAVEKLKDGWEINQLRAYPGNNRMLISLKKGSEVDNTNIISFSPGKNGYSESGSGVTGDGKTPKGSWKIISIRTSGENKPVYSKTGSNMGASFWLLNPTVNGERGIGIHGNKNGTLGVTNGCLRLSNADLLALLPYIKTGIPVIIQ